MRLLELFSGTHSIGKAFAAKGWEVTSLDIDPKADATITADILTWDYRVYEESFFQAIWASPVCTMFSRARTTAKTPRDLAWADSLVAKTLEIIDYFKPKIWAFENPSTGLLKEREVVRGTPWKDLTYCSYGYQYKKPTRIWTNSKLWQPRPICCKANPCAQLVNGKHPMSAQRACCKLQQLYSIPPQLCQEIAQSWTDELREI